MGAINSNEMKKMKIPQVVHEIVWDHDKVGKYWDVFGNIKPDSPWFSIKALGWLLPRIKIILKDKTSHKANIKILDMGSGSGEFIESVRQYTGCDCYGVDLSEDRVSIASKQFPQVSFCVGSLAETGLESSSFDLIISTQTIEHLLDEDVDQSIIEMRRLLKTDGRLLLTTRFEEDLNIGRKVCPDCHAVFLHSQHMQSFDINRLSVLLERYGLATIETGRSRCRNHVNEFIPKRFKFVNRVLYKIFGNYLDRKIGNYLYSISKRVG